ncbi:MAG: hypothetical protein N3A56_05375 [Thermodesulfobacteriaceae bacterium]|nr:hypothetical protein [Thermodesulfobacteriaceae bacterium]
MAECILGLCKIPKILEGCLSGSMILYGIGTIVGLKLLTHLMRDMRPLLVTSTKEVVAFQHWLNTQICSTKEFFEDVWAEAKHLYRQEVEKKISILQKQQELLERIRSQLV